MKSFDINIDEKYFNLLWRSLSERETELEASIGQVDSNADESALLGNELVYLRMCKKDLEENAREAGFSEGVFSLDDDFVDLTDL